jgi:hypothetical protein
MSRLSKYSLFAHFFGHNSVFNGFFTFFTVLIGVLVVGIVTASPSRAERGFFNEDGEQHWGLGRFEDRARSGSRSPANRAAIHNRVDVEDDEDISERRSASNRRGTAQRNLPRRRAAGRPRLTPNAATKPAPRTRVASLGPAPSVEAPAAFPSLSGGAVTWHASVSCLAANLRSVIEQVASFGRVTVNSTCRSVARNRRVGGASHSWHLSGNAADVRIAGNWRAAAAFLRSAVGGFKHYGGGLFHIDNGPKRSF